MGKSVSLVFLKSRHKHSRCFASGFSIVLLLFLNLGIINAYAQAERISDPELLERGKILFQENCAECHGQQAQGTVENWQIAGDDGKYPPPPLNGTAHAWHHPIGGLAHTIKNGTLEMGGSMPGWKDKLSDDEIFAIILWISSLWPDEIYESWMQRNVE
jgi:mono/diheme cytochrome c family protein